MWFLVLERNCSAAQNAKKTHAFSYITGAKFSKHVCLIQGTIHNLVHSFPFSFPLIVSFITQPRHKMPLHNAMFLPLVIVLSGPLLDHFSGEPNLSDRNLVIVLQLNGSKVYNLGIRRQTWVQFNKKHIPKLINEGGKKCASKVRKKN